MAFAPSKGKRHLRKEKEALSLTSMMDMMTIILLFLLKNISTSGALLKPSPYLELPVSIRDMEPRKEVSILVTREGILEDVDEGKPINKISDRAELEDPANTVIPSLEKFYEDHKEFSKKLGQRFTGVTTIQCDKEISYDWLLKVINTCGQTEYSTIDFLIIKAKG